MTPSRASRRPAPGDLLNVDDLRDDLGRRSTGSGMLAVAGRGLQLGIGVGSVAVLGRLLTPADFGLLAMVAPVVVLVNEVLGLGIPAAILYRDPLGRGELSRGFWFAAGFNLIVTGALGLAGFLLAALFDEPRVARIALVWAPVLYLLGLASFPEAILKRRLRFGTVVGIQTGALAVGSVAAVVAALLGAGYWALVLQYTVADLVRSVLLWVISPWRPESPERVHDHDLRSLREYGRHLTAYRGLAWVGHQLDRLLVGGVGGATALGLYDIARRWAWFPFFELYRSLTDVAVSTFSRLEGETERYGAFVRRAFGLVLGVSLPFLAWVFVDARRILLLLLGNQWLDAAVFMRLMCLAAFAGSLTLLTQWLYNSLGLTRRQFRWALIQSGGTVTGLAIGALYGPLGIAIGLTAATVALALPSVLYCAAAAPLASRDVLGAAVRPMAFSIVAAVGGALFKAASPAVGVVPGVLGTLLSCLGVYAASWLATPGGRRAVREGRQMLAGARAEATSDVGRSNGAALRS